MQLISLASALVAAALTIGQTPVSANPTVRTVVARNTCLRPDGTLEERAWSAHAIVGRSTCDLSNAGGAGDPLPNSYCQATFGNEAPCCVEDGVGGAFCTTCTHGIHNC